MAIILLKKNKQTKTEESHWSCAKEPETPYKTHFRTYVLNTIKMQNEKAQCDKSSRPCSSTYRLKITRPAQKPLNTAPKWV